jgi:hypothetical protein
LDGQVDHLHGGALKAVHHVLQGPHAVAAGDLQSEGVVVAGF